jgi:hypothetical protein
MITLLANGQAYGHSICLSVLCHFDMSQSRPCEHLALIVTLRFLISSLEHLTYYLLPISATCLNVRTAIRIPYTNRIQSSLAI